MRQHEMFLGLKPYLELRAEIALCNAHCVDTMTAAGQRMSVTCLPDLVACAWPGRNFDEQERPDHG